MNMKVAINGFGRIGRLTFRHLAHRNDIEVLAINDLGDNSTLAHLLAYDSAQGHFSADISVDEETMTVNGKRVLMLQEPDPARLPWKELGVDVVLECTGRFRSAEQLNAHITAGAKRVILSAPPKGDVPMVVLGVNDDLLSNAPAILSNASCTTNCLAPMIDVLDKKFGVERAYMTTIHAYTADQRLQDAPHKDLRRARAAALSIIPTTTGAASAVGKVIPHLQGKLDGVAIRVPVAAGSITDAVVDLKTEATAEQVNAAMREAAQGRLKGIMQYSELPLVSCDIVGNTHSVIFDAPLTKADGKTIKIFGWYDNEAGYAARLADLIGKLA
ncbi:MAG: type I glyceraldehyde-3-phosphate dehydrogenase [Flavobacteriales bacterium]|nr:type I glyceraldehyde-3-phosphate dehydrogenase [Flavobacteriales bacterium]